MSCGWVDVTCKVKEAAGEMADTMLGQVGQATTAAAQWVIDKTATWWVMQPSISLYPDANNTNPDATPIDTVAWLHGLIMSITMIVAVGGILWNGLLMVLSRKPTPLVNVLRGLWNTALWAAVGIFGTQLLLTGTDEFSKWVINDAMKTVGQDSFGKTLSSLFLPVNVLTGAPAVIIILLTGIALVSSLIQAVLMVFRNASVLILAAITPLAASGSFTNATSSWQNKLLSWQLALIFYKPMAALIYATMIRLQGKNGSTSIQLLLAALAMFVVALVALPVLLKFFNWTVGSLQNGGGVLGMVGTAGAAGMHAAATMRGAPGGQSVTSHARYMDDTFNRTDPPPAGGLGPGPGPGPSSGSSPSSPPPRPPAFVGPAPAGGAAPGAAAGAGASTGAGAGAGAAGAGSGAAAGAAAATGPAAPAVLGAVAVGGAVVHTGKAAAGAAADAASESTKDG